MANQITGKILYIYPTQQITTKDGKPFLRRSLVIDTTRFDPYTGERGFENTPQLEFAGEQCQELDRYTVGQVVTISFDVQGSRYRNADGKEQIFTRLRPYRIELRQARQQTAPQYAPQYAPQQAEAPQQVAAPQQTQQVAQPQYAPQQPPVQQGWTPPMVDANGNPIEGSNGLPF